MLTEIAGIIIKESSVQLKLYPLLEHFVPFTVGVVSAATLHIAPCHSAYKEAAGFTPAMKVAKFLSRE